MYRDKQFRIRDLDESVADIAMAAEALGDRVREVEKVFVADGDALIMPLSHWLPILDACAAAFPRLRQVSCYAMATNVLAKSDDELATLRAHGLSLLYLGPETGDPQTFKRIVKGQGYEEHVEAAERAHRADMRLSVIFLLGAGGAERSDEHAAASARLATAMNPAYLAALTLTVVPDTPLAKLQRRGGFELPDVHGLLRELRTACRATATRSSASSTRRSRARSRSARRCSEGFSEAAQWPCSRVMPGCVGSPGSWRGLAVSVVPSRPVIWMSRSRS